MHTHTSLSVRRSEALAEAKRCLSIANHSLIAARPPFRACEQVARGLRALTKARALLARAVRLTRRLAAAH